MIRDPLYRDIVQRLGDKVNADTFEHCAADLLRQVYPSVVAVPGGSDAGLDGSLHDEKGRPLLLVTTTSDDAVRNLRKNLKSHLDQGGERRVAVFATSRRVTAPGRRKLEAAAQKLGFELREVHERTWFADSLYEHPRWRRDLLGLSGAPAALSIRPRTSRRLLDLGLVGRAKDLEWLRATRGDKVVVGVPGSGKTSTVSHLVRAGALFLVESDPERIADAIRSAKPTIVIVDDAHLDPQQLVKLRHLREEIGAKFSIIATTWAGEAPSVQHALEVGDSARRILQPLSGKEIVEVVKRMGLTGTTALLREIVEQARGRPGLAVTLAQLCLNGDVRAVVFGDAIVSRGGFSQVLGDLPREMIAAFAVGGEAGIPIPAVAQILGTSVREVRHELARMAFAGVIEPRGEWIVVVPAALRVALVHDVFFGQVPLPGIDQLATAASSLEQVLLTVIRAASRGAKVERDWLLPRLENASSGYAWAAFAALGGAEAQLVLEEHPELLAEVSPAGLVVAPETFIPALLEAAVPEAREPHSYPDHPFRKLQDWAWAIEIQREDRLRRRRMLLDEAARWLRGRGDVRVGLRALVIALSPRCAQSTTDPGDENTLTISSGLLPLADMREHARLWTAAVEAIRSLASPDWKLVLEATTDWVYPSKAMMGRAAVPAEVEKFARLHATRMLRDLINLASHHPGVLHAIAEMRDHVGFRLRIGLDPDFEIVFPRVDLRNLADEEARNARAARTLGEAWANQDPELVSDRIAMLEAEAAAAGLRMWPRETPHLCAAIAAVTKDPMRWAQALSERTVPGDLVAPFLDRLVRERPTGWEELLERCMSHPATRPFAVAAALEADAGDSATDLALAHIASWGAQGVASRGKASDEVVARLLEHSEASVAGAAAVGLWHRLKDQIPSSLLPQWRAAVLRSPVPDEDGFGHWIGEILEQDPELGFEWLKAQSREVASLGAMYGLRTLCRKAVAGLSEGQRVALLNEISYDTVVGEFVRSRLLGSRGESELLSILEDE